MVDKPVEWRKFIHDILDEYIEDFYIKAHKLLDRILDLECINEDSFIIDHGTVALSQTVMILMGSKDYRPASKQIQWQGEIAMLKKVLKR